MASMVIMPISVWLAWRSVKHLGKQWRIAAGLYSDHELVRSGPYGVLRHPIYASLLGMLMGTGMVVTWWPNLFVGVVVFLGGTEIRVRAEDKLLSSRFGEVFKEYQDSVPAYIPFVAKSK
jgi:protein-S-isoprenylcysteine O-methyltransferase Ste14